MEVARSETCMSLPSSSACCGTVVTWPSHEPARVFNWSKDFCASDWANARVESNIGTTDSTKRRHFTVSSSLKYSVARAAATERLLYYTVIVNYNNNYVKLFLGVFDVRRHPYKN